MEESRKSRRRINQSFGSKSVVGSLVLAVVAVVTVVTLGFNSSYAIPEETKLPDNFKTAEVTKELSSDTQFFVSPYFTDGGTQVFCVEHMRDFMSDVEFDRGDLINDYGLLHLMANVYPNKSFGNVNEDLQSWMSQVAIWLYLYRITDLDNDGQINDNVSEDSPHYIDPTDITKIQNARGVVVDGDPDLKYYTLNTSTGGVSTGNTTENDPLLYEVINNLVTEAIANRGKSNKDLIISHADELSITQDEKFYQTSAISVAGTPSDNFNGYELKVLSAPVGTIVVNANGEEIKDLTNFGASDKFYFRIPVDKVNDELKTVKFSVTGSFDTYEGNYYVAEDAQTIASVASIANNVNKGAEISLNYTPRVPDTGMSTAQTVYFVGLIILLSGVGIIYANVKPEESK